MPGVLFLLAFHAALPLLGPALVPAERPNIVVILADDLGYSDVGCYGGEIRTPHLDGLAAAGLRFTQFYNAGRCCPTRASLLTGLYPHQTGVGHMMSDRGLDGYRGDLNEHCVTLAEVLRESGYATLMAGKWHVTKQLGHWSGDDQRDRRNWPLQRGFDRFWGTVHGAGSYFDPVSLTEDNDPLPRPKGSFYYTDAISDQAAGMIRAHVEQHGTEPFFCYVAYTAPHWPLHALPQDIARYRGRYDLGWDVLREERLIRMRNLGLLDPRWSLSQRDPKVAPFEEAPYQHWQRAAMEVYAAMVDRMDQGIGRIVETLEQLGALDHTLLLFLADNGGCQEGGTNFESPGTHGGLSRAHTETPDGRPVRHGYYATTRPGPADTYQEYGRPWANASNTPFRLYKHFVHEGGIATPFIVHWPEGFKERGALRSTPGHLVDVMATCVDLAEATYPETRQGHPVTAMEGTSLVPALLGQPSPERALFWEHERNRAIRIGRWKLVARGTSGPWELYDLEADRTETHDLAVQHPDRVATMGAQWEAWAERTGVKPWP